MPIYFIQRGDDGPVKIGFANDVLRRIAALRTGSSAPIRVLFVFDGAQSDERALHVRFAAHRLHGEWFSPVAEILSGNVALKRLPNPKRREPATPLIAGAGMRLGTAAANVAHAMVAMKSASAPEFRLVARAAARRELEKLERINRETPNALDYLRRRAGEPDGGSCRGSLAKWKSLVALVHSWPDSPPAA